MHPVIDLSSRPKGKVTPIESIRIAEIKAAGGGGDELRALCFAKAGKERDSLHKFFLHFLRHHHVVIPAFELLADEAISKGHPERLGCETLSANARYRFRDFPLSNNERPGYVIALRIKRPDLAGMLDAEAVWPEVLMRSGWNPWRTEPGR